MWLFGQRDKLIWVADFFETEVLNVIAEVTQIPVVKVNIDDHFGNDLGIASLDFVDLELAIEQRFQVSVEGLLITEKLPRICDLVQYLRQHLGSRRASPA